MQSERSRVRSKWQNAWAKTNSVGVLALGSHEERHGATLPLDTDAKLAAYVALESAKRTGARFLGVICSSYELPGIDTGHHQTLEQLIDELRATLQKASATLGIKATVLVNGHGGNNPLRNHVKKLEQEVGMKLVFNTKIIELEGPHAGTAESSMAAAIGIADISKLCEHTNFKKHPEVGFVGLKEAQKRYAWARKHAKEVIEKGVQIDIALGTKLLERAIVDIVKNIRAVAR